MVEQLLNKLDKVRANGRDRWMACCPVHNDSSPSMLVTDKGDKITVYCFSCGAKGPEVVNTIGLPVSLLFKEQPGSYDKQDYILSKTQADDEMFIAVFEAARSRDEVLRHDDFTRYKLAQSRQDLRADRAKGQVA